MKSFIVFALFVAVAVAGPVYDYKNAEIVNSNFENIGVDGFSYGYESSDGKAVKAEAVVKNLGTENEALEVRGQYSFITPEGIRYLVTYVANENGYQPSAPQIIA